MKSHSGEFRWIPVSCISIVCRAFFVRFQNPAMSRAKRTKPTHNALPVSLKAPNDLQNKQKNCFKLLKSEYPSSKTLQNHSLRNSQNLKKSGAAEIVRETWKSQKIAAPTKIKTSKIRAVFDDFF